MNDNFYWITGDPYFIIEAKNDIVNRVNKNNEYEIKDISDLETISDIVSSLCENNIFNKNKKKIFVYRGSIPDSKKAGIIMSVIKENLFFLLEESPNKKTKFYKKFSFKIDNFPIVIKNGKIDKKAQSQARKIIKFFVKWNGNDILFESIFEFSRFSYGVTINDIKKIRFLYGDESKWTFEKIRNDLFGIGQPDIKKMVGFIKDGKKKEALYELENKISDKFLEKNGIFIFFSLMDFFKFIQSCVFAKELGAENNKKISEKAAILCGEQNSNKILNRMYYNSDLINSISGEEITRKISYVGISMRDWIVGTISKKNIIKKLIFRIV